MLNEKETSEVNGTGNSWGHNYKHSVSGMSLQLLSYFPHTALCATYVHTNPCNTHIKGKKNIYFAQDDNNVSKK